MEGSRRCGSADLSRVSQDPVPTVPLVFNVSDRYEPSEIVTSHRTAIYRKCKPIGLGLKDIIVTVPANERYTITPYGLRPGGSACNMFA